MYRLFIPFLLLFILSCGHEQKEDLYKTTCETDTIFIHDTIPLLNTIYVKGSNHKEAIAPVDTLLEKCMNEKSNSSTMGMIDCYNNTSDLLLLEIKEKETQLVKFLTPSDADLLKKSQKHWEEFMNAEGTFLYSTYYTWANHSKYPSLGREASIDQAAWKYKIIKDRLIALESYYDRIYYQK